MAHRAESHRLTAAYRTRVKALAVAAERAAVSAWPSIETLDTTDWANRTAVTVAATQTEGVRLVMAYLAAFLRSETGSGTVRSIDTSRYVGVSRDGQPLPEALISPLVGVKAKLSIGADPAEALDYGLNRARRMVAFEVQQTPRQALLDAAKEDDRFAGFQRATKGTCGACLELSGNGGPEFPVHPGCECVPEPLVAGVSNRFPVQTGAELWASKSVAEQDAAVGPDAAKKIRAGVATLADLLARSPQANQPDFITQAPTKEL